jgi:hypothetical protein
MGWRLSIYVTRTRAIIEIGTGLSYAAEIAGRQTVAILFDSINTSYYVLTVMISAWGLIAFVFGFEHAIIERALKKNSEN